jgi:hypothetical protein
MSGTTRVNATAASHAKHGKKPVESEYAEKHEEVGIPQDRLARPMSSRINSSPLHTECMDTKCMAHGAKMQSHPFTRVLERSRAP